MPAWREYTHEPYCNSGHHSSTPPRPATPQQGLHTQHPRYHLQLYSRQLTMPCGNGRPSWPAQKQSRSCGSAYPTMSNCTLGGKGSWACHTKELLGEPLGVELANPVGSLHFPMRDYLLSALEQWKVLFSDVLKWNWISSWGHWKSIPSCPIVVMIRSHIFFVVDLDMHFGLAALRIRQTCQLQHLLTP